MDGYEPKLLFGIAFIIIGFLGFMCGLGILFKGGLMDWFIK